MPIGTSDNDPYGNPALCQSVASVQPGWWGCAQADSLLAPNNGVTT